MRNPPAHLPSFCCLSSVPLDTLIQLHAAATEAIQSTADGQIHGTATEPGYVVQVLEVPAAASVGHGDGTPLRQLGDELLIDATLEALVIGSVDEELGAVGLQLLYGLCRDRRGKHGLRGYYVDRDMLTFVHFHIGNSLPLVHGHEPPRLGVLVALLAPAAQVYDQLLLVAAQGAEDGVEAGLAELAAGEEEGRDDDLLSNFAASKHVPAQFKYRTVVQTIQVHI